MKVSQTTAYALHVMMYLVRHVTQLPATAMTIAKAEGIPTSYIPKVFRRLVRARYVQSVRGSRRGYVLVKDPERISLLELFETVEGEPLFDECLLRHGECVGTSESCYIRSHWLAATEKIRQSLLETSVAAAAWQHPDHRFGCGREEGAADEVELEEDAVGA